MSELNAGEIVIVFQDPYTREKPEGKARLIKWLYNEDILERWEVHFVSDHHSQTVDRLIHIDSILEKE